MGKKLPTMAVGHPKLSRLIVNEKQQLMCDLFFSVVVMLVELLVFGNTAGAFAVAVTVAGVFMPLFSAVVFVVFVAAVLDGC